MPSPHLAAAPEPELSLPGWIYRDPEFFEVEMERVIRPSWQVVCHDSEIPGAGRLADPRLSRRERPRHPRRRRRRPRLLQRLPPPRLAGGERRRRLREAADLPLSCLDLRARRPADRGSAQERLSRARYRRSSASSPVELEAWRGFLFVRLEPGGPSVAEMMAPHEAEIAPYRFEALEALGRVTLRPRDGQLEERRRQLFGRPPHRRRPSRPHPPVRPGLCDLGGRACRPDGRAT